MSTFEQVASRWFRANQAMINQLQSFADAEASLRVHYLNLKSEMSAHRTHQSEDALQARLVREISDARRDLYEIVPGTLSEVLTLILVMRETEESMFLQDTLRQGMDNLISGLRSIIDSEA